MHILRSIVILDCLAHICPGLVAGADPAGSDFGLKSLGGPRVKRDGDGSSQEKGESRDNKGEFQFDPSFLGIDRFGAPGHSYPSGSGTGGQHEVREL